MTMLDFESLMATYPIPCAIAGFACIAFVAARIKKYLYFHGAAYKDAKNALFEFQSELKVLLSKYEAVPDEEWDRIRNIARTADEFFHKRPYKLSECIIESLNEYAHLYDYKDSHSLEVDFASRYLLPFRGMLSRNGYISRKEVGYLVKDAESIVERLKERQHLFDETSAGIKEIQDFEQLREKHNKLFVEEELRACDDFFSSVASYSLDRQQKECCVVDDDSALVIAGAGSGKTTVIMAKVAYLIERRKIDPSSILLISFTNKAADEMAERIEKRLGRCGVEAMTFHRLGLRFLKEFSGKRYDIAGDDFLLNFVHSHLTGSDNIVDGAYIRNVVEYFAYYFKPDITQREYGSFGELIEEEQVLNLHTLRSMVASQSDRLTMNGEKVRSFEEVLIANYLFLNGVEYQYEMKYPKEYEDDKQHRAYHPDFYLPDFDIYLEHYAVDEKGSAPSYFSLADQAKYVSSMKWKRELHKKHENKYIESFSWWNTQGKLLENLEKELVSHGVAFKPRDVNEVWRLICEKAKMQVGEFEKLLSSFITLFKSNGYTEEKFDELQSAEAETEFDTHRQKSFLSIAKRIYCAYELALNKESMYDFSDMINKATEVVDGLSRSDLPYRYIIVDEYQDASVGRMRLLKAIVDKTDAHLFCVGDDWQSIFRFAGSDINLFTSFSDYFGPSVEMKIENTYRNSQELIDIMGRFVMKNPSQVNKTLKSNLHCPNPIGLVFYSTEKESSKDGSSEGRALDVIVKSVVKKVETSGRKNAKVLLLGRTKYDEVLISKGKSLKRKGCDGLYETEDHPEIVWQFLTVHKSKGLEGDYVILLNVKNDLLGFPNRIVDDPLLGLVLARAEGFEFAEERRLFYVALTRTKNVVYLIVPERHQSPFVDELDELGVSANHFVGSVATKDIVPCPKCRKGRLIVRKGDFGEFMICTNAPRCDYKIAGRYTAESKRCEICGNFLVLREVKNFTRKSWYAKKKNGGGNKFLGCANYPHCNYTEACGDVRECGIDERF